MQKKRTFRAAILMIAFLLSGCAGNFNERSQATSSAVGSVAPESNASAEPAPSPGAGKSAVYLYLCGSTLETKSGAATKNIDELLKAQIPEDTTVVIQTGGAKKWRGHDISPDHITHYEVKDGKLIQIEQLENASMGKAETLAAFIDFATKEYPAEKTALILWDHGGGALGEVCYDENYVMDCLTTAELKEALQGKHFDLIGFDACLMATNETAAAVKDAADYMLASEEIEPTGGWDYVALAENFSLNKSTEDIGRAVCDAYIEKCANAVSGDMATLSLFDLTGFSAFSAAFDDFATSLSSAAEKKYGNFDIIRVSQQACKFGAAGRDEGASNLIDLYGLADRLAEDSPQAERLIRAIDELVPYTVGGQARDNLGGVSLFFPQNYVPSELEEYLRLCSSEAYKNYLSGIYGNVVYSIVFEDMGSVDASGNFTVKLSEESRKYLKSVQFSLLQLSYNEDAEQHIEIVCLGEDNYLETDWDQLTFTSNFRGIWLALDGVYLNYSVVESSEEHILFSAPVEVNGKRTNLRFMFIWDDDYTGGGYYKTIGLWDGLDENNLADRQITPLKEGDQVTVLRKEVDLQNDVTISNASLSRGETVTIGPSGGVIEELSLVDTSQYRYVFIADDIFGNRIYSNTAYFQMLYTYEELLENPVPDGKCAGEIVGIDWDSSWGPVG